MCRMEAEIQYYRAKRVKVLTTEKYFVLDKQWPGAYSVYEGT
jgi:hypothetical protein